MGAHRHFSPNNFSCLRVLIAFLALGWVQEEPAPGLEAAGSCPSSQ